jgi:hypothetical protein
MSALGQNQTLSYISAMSALPPMQTSAKRILDVGFVPKFASLFDEAGGGVRDIVS